MHVFMYNFVQDHKKMSIFNFKNQYIDRKKIIQRDFRANSENSKLNRRIQREFREA